MREIKALLIIFLFLFMVVNWCRPVFAEDENSGGGNYIELIPLSASYDTKLKIDTENIGTTGNTSQPSLNMISLRRIVPIILESSLNSKFVCIGDQIMARLKEDLYYGTRLIARQNSLLKGRVVSYRGARTLSDTLFQKEDRLKSSSAIGIQFDELVVGKGGTIPLTARPVHQESYRQGADGYTYGLSVDCQGRIIEAGRSLSREQKNAGDALRIGTFSPLPGSVLLNIAAAPVVMGVVGAASPDVAFNKPVDRNLSHRRLKGMAYGFVTNLPGAFFVQAVVQKGNEVVLSNGDELMIDLAINNFSDTKADIATAEFLDVKAQIVGAAPTKARLLPAALSPPSDGSPELALKTFIPTND